jgi:LysR family transcriptional regulator, flagellar master operon regulator
MDIVLARTFMTVVEVGSFIDAARRMHVTQSTVSARVKTLEDLLGRPLFDRSKSGATLTPIGVQFQKHALALIRVWTHAQLEAEVAEQHRDHLSVGADPTLWDGLLLNWIAWMRSNITDIAVTAIAAAPGVLMQRLAEGTLDLAILYRPPERPGLIVEHLFDEEFVLVTSAQSASRRLHTDFVAVDWGADVQADTAPRVPEFGRAGLTLNLGSLGLDFLLATEGTGYFPQRLVKSHIAGGRLKLIKKGRRYVCPVAMMYPETRDDEAYEPIIAALRAEAAKAAGVRG